MKQFKYIALILVLLIFFQAADFVIYNSGPSQTNSKFIFGLIGTNFLAINISFASLALLWFVLRKDKSIYLPLIVVSAATFSNIIDRILYGGVVDYFNIGIWPSFNLSDIGILVGIFVMTFKLLLNNKLVGRNI